MIKSIIKRIIISFMCLFIVSSIFIPIIKNAISNDTAKKITLKTVDDVKKYKTELENKYPGYYDKLLSLKQNNANWTFTLYYTGINWNTAIYNETEGYHGRSLVQGKSGEWLCAKCGDKIYDGTSWKCASKEAVAYLMDARNYLQESTIFQFEKLSYDPETYTIFGINKVLNGTFMYQKNIREYYNNPNYENVTFAQAIMNAATKSGVSPYYLAARIRQEVGISGSGSTSGTYKNYEGYFNFYNIGANASSDPIKNGLEFAKNKAGSYLGPWNTPCKSIEGGAIWIAKNYISIGQDTLYFQKFDVVSNGTLFYNHQYMQNIFAAKNEGITTYNTYKSIGLLDNNYNFIVPLYENMPKALSGEPKVTKITGINEKITLSTSKKTLGVKEKYKIKYNVSPKNTEVTFTSSNKNIATVDKNGKVTANKKGTVTITAKTSNGMTAKMKITVKKAPKSIRLNAKSKTLKKNKTFILKPKLSSGSAGKITYSSSNKKVATVSSSGKIVAKKKGITYITAKTYNGKTAKIKIKVK